MTFDKNENEKIRLEIVEMIDARIRQAIVLANHIRINTWYDMGYASEKAHSIPVLDKKNTTIHEKIRAIIMDAYGVDITEQ